ncbi:MAG: hypothetical protein K2X82_18315 [Gemmataceae bacterium]|nr:hypothetical protein [Gemmataceae bacterium]
MQLTGVCACLYGMWQCLRASGADIGGVLTHKQSSDDRDGVAALVWVRAMFVGAQIAACTAAGELLAGLLNDVWGYEAGVTFTDAGAADNWWFSGPFAVVVGFLAAFRCAGKTNNWPTAGE